MIRNRYIEVTDRPTIIVGERPGRQRQKDEGSVCFHGNRTGDFVENWIKGRKNIVLTNAQKYYYSERIKLSGIEHEHGQICLRSLIVRMNPKHIVCLGTYATDCVKDTRLPLDCRVTSLPHPSYVLRFNRTDLLKLYYDYWNNWDLEQSCDVTQQPLSWLE